MSRFTAPSFSIVGLEATRPVDWMSATEAPQQPEDGTPYLVDGTINGIATVGEVVDVSEVHRFKAPTHALQQVSGGRAVITGQRHFSQVTVVGGPVVVEVMLAVPIRVQGSLVHGLQRTLGVREFVRTVIAILVTVLKVPRWDRT